MHKHDYQYGFDLSYGSKSNRKEVNTMTTRRKIEWALLVVIVAVWVVILPIIL
jgi:hypothetical protein